MHALITYLLSAMFAWAPPADHDYYADRQDTVERYESIAKDIADVALDPNEPPLFGGPQGRAQTALYVTSIAFYESGGLPARRRRWSRQALARRRRALVVSHADQPRRRADARAVERP